MEQRNVDFEIPVTRQQWEQLGRRAAALGKENAGFSWSEGDFERIHVYLTDEQARGLWSRYVSDEENYGESERELAQFVFNGGRPYARLEAPPSADEPAVNSAEEDTMEVGQQRWIREKWDLLMKESGLHFERGHIPQS